MIDIINVLANLHDANLIIPPFSLNWDDMMTAVFIEPNIKFVYFDLSDAIDHCSKVGLKAVCGELEKLVARLNGLYDAIADGPSDTWP